MKKVAIGIGLLFLFLSKKDSVEDGQGSLDPSLDGIDVNGGGRHDQVFVVDGQPLTAVELYMQGYGFVSPGTFPVLYAGYQEYQLDLVGEGEVYGFYEAGILGATVEWDTWVNPERYTALYELEASLGGDPGVSIGTDTIIQALLGNQFSILTGGLFG